MGEFHFACPFTRCLLLCRILLWLEFPTPMKKSYRMTIRTMVLVPKRRREARKGSRERKRKRRKGGRPTVTCPTRILVEMRKTLIQNHPKEDASRKVKKKAPHPQQKRNLLSRRCQL